MKMDLKLNQAYEINRDHQITALKGHVLRVEVINLMARDKEQPIQVKLHTFLDHKLHGTIFNLTEQGKCLAGGKTEQGVELFHLAKKIDCQL